MPSQSDITHFLIVFDRDAGKQLDLIRFQDFKEAIEAYNRVEDEYADRPRIDVVLLGADSVETIRFTHSSYFREGPFTFEDAVAELESYITPGLAQTAATADG